MSVFSIIANEEKNDRDFRLSQSPFFLSSAATRNLAYFGKRAILGHSWILRNDPVISQQP